MQRENQTFLDFSERTDALAVRLGCSVQELPERLDFSRSSLFAYRTGKAKISAKAWAKLEKVEAEFGLGPVSESPEKSGSMLEDSVPYRVTPADTLRMIRRIESRLDNITELIGKIADVLKIKRE